MRLFDRFANETVFGKEIAIIIPTIAILEASNIASHWISICQKKGMTADDYPFATCPWSRVFVTTEENQSKYSGIEDDILERGVFISSYTGDELPRAASMFKEKHISCDRGQQLLDAIMAAHSVQVAFYLFRNQGNLHFIDYAYGWSMYDANGGMFEDGLVPTLNKPAYIEQFTKLADPQDDDWMTLNMQVRGSTGIAALAFTYANCKNIQLQPVIGPDSQELKKRRRWKTAENKEYTLQISKTQYANDSERKYPQGIMPEHLCRGHFAHYTEERKLFGKYTGRFFHPPHMRGKKENGTIKKDYAI